MTGYNDRYQAVNHAPIPRIDAATHEGHELLAAYPRGLASRSRRGSTRPEAATIREDKHAFPKWLRKVVTAEPSMHSGMFDDVDGAVIGRRHYPGVPFNLESRECAASATADG